MGEARTAELDAALAKPLEGDALEAAHWAILQGWRARARFTRVRGAAVVVVGAWIGHAEPARLLMLV